MTTIEGSQLSDTPAGRWKVYNGRALSSPPPIVESLTPFFARVRASAREAFGEQT